MRHLESLKLASKATLRSCDINDFEERFKDKKYVKTEFKEYCVSKYHVNKKVFKNKETIELFLNKQGYKFSKKKGDRNNRYISSVPAF